MTELQRASREELLEIIGGLLERVEVLESEVEQLREENLRLRKGKGSGTPLAIKPSRREKEKGERKRRKEAFVRRRETPDEVCHHAAECCPDCGRKLSGGWPHRKRQTIELVLQKKVVEHVLWARWCGVCRQRVLPEVAREFQVQGRRRFGVSVQAVVATLHIAGRIPMRMVKSMLRELFGLQLSAGEVVELLKGAKQAGEAELAELLEQVRGSPAVCGDETGWREDGQNGYVWGFFTPTMRYFVYRRSRGGQVPIEVLGEEFGGTVTCDFYAGYNRLGMLQRCWVHLLRDAKELAEINADQPEIGAWRTALRDLYQEAKAFSSPKARARRQARRDFERRAKALAQPYSADAHAPQRLLAQRVLKHLHELFVFVTDPAVAADNNLAERSLRPAVIARKISGGTRSPKGSETQMGLMSLFGTWAAQERNLLASCEQLLLASL